MREFFAWKAFYDSAINFFFLSSLACYAKALRKCRKFPSPKRRKQSNDCLSLSHPHWFFPKFLSRGKQFGATEHGVNSFERHARWEINENHKIRAVNHFEEVLIRKNANAINHPRACCFTHKFYSKFITWTWGGSRRLKTCANYASNVATCFSCVRDF